MSTWGFKGKFLFDYKIQIFFFFFSFFSYYGHQGDENTDSSLAEKQVDKLLNFIAMHFFDFFFFDEMDSYHFCYILTIKKKSLFLVH